MKALGDVQHLRVPMAQVVEPRLIVETHSVDHQGVSLPMADSSVPSNWDSDPSDGHVHSGRHCDGINLADANLTGAKMTECFLFRSKLVGANLTGAFLQQADLSESDLTGARLVASNLEEASMLRTKLVGADLTSSILTNAHIVGTDLSHAILSGCNVYGVAVWDVNLSEADQRDLVITRWPLATVTTDYLEIAQFLYLLLNNQKIRHVIDAITSKVVLILGRFTPDRKAVLDAIRD